MTAASNPSWTTRWITFTAGWWKSWVKATRTRLANIPTRRQRATASFHETANRIYQPAPRGLVRAAALVLSLVLALGGPCDAFAQSKKKKKSKKPGAVPCRVGCKPETSVPDLGPASPEDAAAQQELSTLARELRNAMPGAYEKLAAFAGKNAASSLGARAALALGYDDYTKNRGPQALAWLNKAVGSGTNGGSNTSAGGD